MRTQAYLRPAQGSEEPTGSHPLAKGFACRGIGRFVIPESGSENLVAVVTQSLRQAFAALGSRVVLIGLRPQ